MLVCRRKTDNEVDKTGRKKNNLHSASKSFELSTPKDEFLPPCDRTMKCDNQGFGLFHLSNYGREPRGRKNSHYFKIISERIGHIFIFRI